MYNDSNNDDRGYDSDKETGLYYLRSRYYNSAWCRFVNADSVLVERSIFTYCCANPPNRVDSEGQASSIAFSNDKASDWKLFTEGGLGGGYTVDLSIALRSSLWGSPLLGGYWDATYIQTPLTASLDTGVNPMRAHTSLKYDPHTTDVGWRVGQNIFNRTEKGDAPSWSTIRARWWKNEVIFNGRYYYENYGFDALENMKQGRAPIGPDKHPLELHHPNGREGENYYYFHPMVRENHIRYHMQQ